MIRALENSDELSVKSVVSKSIYLVSVDEEAGKLLSGQVLSVLQMYTSHDVAIQIRVYAHAAYARGLARLAARTPNEPLSIDYVDSLPAIFVSQGTLKVGEKDFVPEINNHVLEILACETSKRNKRRIENEEIFQIIDQILFTNENLNYSIKVTTINLFK